MAIIKAKQKEYHARVPNETARDKDLSLKAKGLLCVLLSMDEDWKIYKKQIASFSKDKYDSTSAAFDELIEKGYIVNHGRSRNDKGMLDECLYEVFSEKQPLNTNKSSRDYPDLDNPNLGKPDLSNYTINSIENKEKEKQEVSLNINTEQSSVEGDQLGLFSDKENKTTSKKTDLEKKVKKDSSTHPAVKIISKYWFEEFRKSDRPNTPSKWATRTNKIKSIVDQIIEYCLKEASVNPSEEEILDIFKQMTTACSQSNSTFYQTIDLNNIESRFSSIITLTEIKIKNGTAKQSTASANQQDAISYFEQLLQDTSSNGISCIQ